MREQPRFVRWTDTPEGVEVRRAYRSWLKEKLGNNLDISFDQQCELQCDFFSEQLDSLNLSERGQGEVFALWGAAAQYLESQYIRNLVRHAL